METTAPSGAATQYQRRVCLPTAPTAAAAARGQVRAAILAWDLPVDPAVAALLTSELVTNALTRELSGSFLLVISRPAGRLRVEVHDTCPGAPVVLDAPADAEAGRGLTLVASLSAEWGYRPTLAGKAVYFTLKSPADL